MEQKTADDGVPLRRLELLFRHLSTNVALHFDHHYMLQDKSNFKVTSLKYKPNESIVSFPYPRLLDDERTRLMTLLPGKPDDELECHLKHIRNLKDHEYEALSYVWGEYSEIHTIRCSGAYIPITANLNTALRRLRSCDRPRVLWIDAICINQTDKAERSRQVRIMQEIYASARQVAVWLGPATDRDSHAFATLESLQTLSHTHDDGTWILPRLGWYKSRNGRIFSGGTQESNFANLGYQHLVNLLHREWFRRTWVIQEVASARDVMVYYGSQCLPWHILTSIYMKLGEQFLPVSQLGGVDAHHSLENIIAIERARRSQSGPLSMSLFHILVVTSFSRCKDPRDKIFAVIGLAKDWSEKRMIMPEYDTREEEVLKTFKDFAIADSINHKSLRVLSCASGPNAPSLPSWVPDWRSIDNVHPFTRYSERTRFCASRDMKPEAWYSANDTVLHVMGKHVDSIAVLGSQPTFTRAAAIFEIDTAKITALAQSFSWLQECRSLAGDKKGNITPSRHNELWRTMTCGLTSEAFPAPSRYSEYFNSYMDFMSWVAEKFQEYLLESRSSPRGIRGLDEVVRHFERHAVIEASLERWSSRRLFAVTENGRLACVPKTTLKEDIVCILLGGEVPYVLRPVGEGFYAVVGECYIDDMMHGQYLSHDAGTREFPLR